MHLATLNAEALAALLAVDVGFTGFPSDCSVERARLITGTVVALLLLAAWYPVRRLLRRVSTGDAGIIAGILAASIILFLGDAWFTYWNLRDCLGGGTGDTGTPGWWPIVPFGVAVLIWKYGVLDGEKPEGDESEGGSPEDGE